METAESPTVERKAPLAIAAAITTLVAVACPQVGDIVKGDHAHWEPNRILYLALIGLATIVLFGTLVRWGANASPNSTRPAKAGLVCSILGALGVVVFFLSTPIILGGAGATLGLEGRYRSRSAGAGAVATAGLVLGVLAFLAGIYIWLVA